MKKVFTLMAMMLTFTLSTFADITIYVQADVAPYLYVWAGADNGAWPGTQMSETETVKGTTFWKKTFVGATSLNAIFNNGKGGQTKDIVAITSDRYFTYDGTSNYTDVTAEYGEVVKAEVKNVKIAGDFTKPTWADGWQDMTVVEEGKEYTYELDATEIGGDIMFKIVVNEAAWIGYSDFSENFVDDPDELLQPADNGNVQINNTVSGFQKYRITVTWDDSDNDIAAGWELRVEGTEERQGEVPDVTISSLVIAGEFNDWAHDPFTEVEANKIYTKDLNLSNVEGDNTAFKLVANNKWLGFEELAINAPEGWVEEMPESGGNIQLNFDTASTKNFKLTATWEGGKDAAVGWTLNIEANGSGDSTGIDELNNEKPATVYYNLQGIRTNNLQRGIYIANGKVMIVK